jgi:GT2 family glycosyltransferase
MNALRALYVTDRWDGPYRYRCQQACEQLRADGAVANVAHVASPELLDALERYGVGVLFRLPYSERVEAIVQRARLLGVPLLFDIDDLTFDPRLEGLMPFRRRYAPEEWAKTYGQQIAGLRRTFDACDAFIGSTPELSEHARRLGKRAHVHPNVAPPAYLKAGRWAARLSRALRVQPTIGYFSGSDTHDEDFSSIAPAIETVLAEARDARLLIVGHLELGGRHPELEQRVVRLPYMHWRDFAFAYAACHVTLAPLSTVNEFTSSKSALKFFEAGAFSTPTVATPVREMASAIEPGKTGWLARTRQDWTDAVLSALDADCSAKVGKAARIAVEKNHSAEANRGRLHAILAEYAVTPKGTAVPPSALEVPDENGPSSRVERALRPGRAARDILSIVRAARRELRPELDIPRLESILDQVEAGGEAVRRVKDHGAYVLSAGDFSDWQSGDQVVARAGLSGESGSRGTDPYLTSPPFAVEARRYRYIVLRLRTKTLTASTKGQIYWKSSDAEPFTELSSASFSVGTDGFDRLYVVDLHRSGSRADDGVRQAWERAGVVTRFRVDPLDQIGSFRLGPIVFLPGAVALDEKPPGLDPSRDGARDFVPLTDSGQGVLESSVAGLGPGGAVRLSLAGPPDKSRETLAEWTRARNVEVERLFTTKEGSVECVLRRTEGKPHRGVDIVIPIYNARRLVAACLTSVARHARGDYRIVLVDDASTDPDLARDLEAFVRRQSRAVLLTNGVNLGFVGTANRGMRHADGRDVLLLNSDTEVSEGFLDGLRDAVYSDPRAGLCSPLSNNATICSVPEFCLDNPLPEGVSLEEMAALVARTSLRQRPTLVTPNGFCLYLRADFLAAVGLFDEENFGKGFGEENDLGERAKAAGYHTVLADDVYVWHAGKGSFGDHGRELERKHAEVLVRRHPRYHPEVAAFVRDNPLFSVHEVVRRHLSRRSLHVEPAVLIIVHASPFAEERGGVEHCIGDLMRGVAERRAVLVYPKGSSLEVAEVIDGDVERPLLYRFPLGHPPERFCHEHPEAIAAFDEILTLFRIGWAHVHHFMHLPLSIARLLAERRIPYVVTVHDFYAVCPSFNLLDVRTNTRCCPASACDAERTASCQRALFTKLGEPLPADPVRFVADHRRAHQALFDAATRVLFPSPSTAHMIGQVLELERSKVEILPHGFDTKPPPAAVPAPAMRGLAETSRAKTGPLRVALIGQIAYPSKGADAYLETMSRLSGAHIEWHVFGRTDIFGYDQRIDALGDGVRVVRHGPYDRNDIVAALVRARIDLGVLQPSWPETYSYTLSEFLAANLPIVARRIGAVADRLSDSKQAVLVESAAEAADAIRRLESERDQLVAMRDSHTAPLRSLDARSQDVASWSARHRELYAACATASHVQGETAASVAECARLNELAVVRDVAIVRGVTVTTPAPEIASRWWYRHAERAKPYVPESVRQLTRRRLSRDGSTTVLKFRLPSKKAKIGQQLTLDRRYLGTTQLTSHGDDPFIVLSHRPFEPRQIKLVRFNLWCSTHRPVFAQLYFQHEGASAFDEQNSITVPLNGSLGQWQEYVFYLDGTDKARDWYDGGAIVALRFDPINTPGAIGLGELSFCDLAPSEQ